MNSAPGTPQKRFKHTIRSALVTGSSGGIGEATARQLARSGIAVAVHGRRVDQVQRVVREIEGSGGRAVPILGDLSQGSTATAVAEQAAEALQGIDLVVNNAAHLQFGAMEEVSLAEVRTIFEVNVFAVMAITDAILPAMRRKGFGRIINVSSIVGWLPFPFMGTYAMTKHALEAYSESLDHEVRKFGVRVSTVQPGYTRTHLNVNAGNVAQSIAEYDGMRQRIVKLIAEKIEHGESAEHVARVIVRAALDRTPQPYYVVGWDATVLRALRSFLPASFFSFGLRRHFRLDESSQAGRDRSS